jgi:hypothetical protein
MYGNDVDPNDAVACFRECNPYFRDGVGNERSFREWYRYWDGSYERSMLSTYDTHHPRYIWRTGRRPVLDID